MEESENAKIIRRTSPILLVLRITVLEIILELVFLAIAWLTSVASREILPGLNQFLFLTIFYFIIRGLQIVVIVYLVWDWLRETFIVTQDELIIEKGRERSIYPLHHIEHIRVEQSKLGKLFKFGTIHIKPEHVDSEIAIDGVEDVNRFSDILERAMIHYETGTKPM